MMMTLDTTRDLTQDLDQALQAHGAWKQRLRAAAVHKEVDLPANSICRDDCCRFGRWLYSLPAEKRESPEARTVQRLHAQFHRAAGAVANMIEDGMFDQALSSLATGGYPQVSAELTRAVVDWKVALMREARAA